MCPVKHLGYDQFSLGLFLAQVRGAPGLPNVDSFSSTYCSTWTHSPPSPVSPQCSSSLTLSACAVQSLVLSGPYVVLAAARLLICPFCSAHCTFTCAHVCPSLGGQPPLTLPLTVSPLSLPLALLKCVWFFFP